MTHRGEIFDIEPAERGHLCGNRLCNRTAQVKITTHSPREGITHRCLEHAEAWLAIRGLEVPPDIHPHLPGSFPNILEVAG